jgi:flagellar hook-associated protein 2
VPGIRFSGMASGLPPNIVDQIMEAERIPVKTMENQKLKEDDKLKLVTDLETKITDITKNISELVGIRGFTNTKLISGAPEIIDGSIDPEKAVTGEWTVEVLQLAQKPGAYSNGFPDRDATQVGVGYLRFNTPEGRKDVYINNINNTLDGVANAINSANVGMRATVVNDRTDKDSPFRLLVTGLQTGEDQQIEFPTVYMLDGDQDVYFDQSKGAQNAKIKLDGFELELPDNKIPDLIPGAVLDLKQVAAGRPIRINVKEDLEVISGKIKTFVEAYNASLSFIQGQHKLQKGPDGKERLGPLGGDGLVRSIESALRQVIMNPMYDVDSNITRVGDLGIEFTRAGTLNFNQEKFNKVLSANPQAVSNFLRGDGFKTGFIPKVKTTVTNLVNGFTSPIANRKRSVQSKIDSINKRIDSKTSQLEKKEDGLRRKFSDLESKMSQLQSQGAAVGQIGMAGGQPKG